MPITDKTRFECTRCQWEGSTEEVQWIPAYEYYKVDESEFPNGETVTACPICKRKTIDHAID